VVPDQDFNPADPDPARVVVGDTHEHGPLWRSGEDGIPQFRKNGRVDYLCNGKRKYVLDCERCSLERRSTAWTAGEGDPGTSGVRYLARIRVPSSRFQTLKGDRIVAPSWNVQNCEPHVPRY